MIFLLYEAIVRNSDTIAAPAREVIFPVSY